MDNISELAPQAVWQIFNQICQIPHPSKHEQALSLWIQDWAKSLQLSVKEDACGNLFISKPATLGMENCKGVILQAHMDMVPQKSSDSTHDFLTDPISPRLIFDSSVTGNNNLWVTADETTLGADNGVGLASALAVLASKDIAHGPLEVFITIDEEAGMTGAFGVKPGWLKGDILINTDSEEEGEIYMGCAGGIDSQATFILDFMPTPKYYKAFNLTLFGLKGGHSGVDIHTGRGNANKLLVRFLREASQKFDLRITELNGGSLRNAIPREASVTFVIDPENINDFKLAVEQYLQQIKQNLSAVEPTLSTLLIEAEPFELSWNTQSQVNILRALNACPNGVMRMSNDIDGVVETSLNLGIIRAQGTKFKAQSLIRSLHDDGCLEIQTMVQSVFELAGANVQFSGGYPSWKPEPKSEIMQVVKSCYEDLFAKTPEIMVMHAGLECGLFKTAYPHWDMVSIGPTIKYPHSPDEKVDVKSVEKYWRLLINILGKIPQK